MLAASEMSGSGDVDEDPVRRIGRDDRGIAQAPCGQAREGRRIRLRPRRNDGEVRDQRLHMRDGLARTQPKRARRVVHGCDDPARALPSWL